MKAVVINCLGELITEKFGAAKWEETLEGAGLPRNTRFLATKDVDEKVAMQLFDAACRTLKITKRQAAEEFGYYWVNVFCPKIYSAYFRGVKSAREFILKMDQIHEAVTMNIANAQPPRFEYRWKDNNTLMMRYKSNRGMIDYLVGLVQGVGKYFKESLNVRKVSSDELEIVFS